MKNNLQAIVAGLVGGAMGCSMFLWITQHGFYALVLPGGMVGICASMFKPKSAVICILCGVIALLMGLFAEWRYAPFAKDSGLAFFLLHLNHKSPVTLLMIGIGAVLGLAIPWNHRHDHAAKAE